jgi:uncharacterized protein YydD (DUF2326 family)
MHLPTNRTMVKILAITQISIILRLHHKPAKEIQHYKKKIQDITMKTIAKIQENING